MKDDSETSNPLDSNLPEEARSEIEEDFSIIDLPINLDKLLEVNQQKRLTNDQILSIENYITQTKRGDAKKNTRNIIRNIEQKNILNELKNCDKKIGHTAKIIEELESKKFKLKELFELRKDLENKKLIECDDYVPFFKSESELVIIDKPVIVVVPEPELSFEERYPNIDPATGEIRDFEKEKRDSAEALKNLLEDEKEREENERIRVANEKKRNKKKS